MDGYWKFGEGREGRTEKPKFLKESIKWSFWRGGVLNHETIRGGGESGSEINFFMRAPSGD